MWERGEMESDLAEELKTLRKGRGVLADRIDQRVGSAVRVLCGITEGVSPAEIREKIVVTLRELIEALPPDLRDPMLAAFALDEAVQYPLYQERIAFAAERLGREQRTVRRRIDEGIARLVELAERRRDSVLEAATGPGWHTTDLRTLVNLELPSPEAFEFRQVVAERDGLTALELALTVTATPGSEPGHEQPEADIDVFAGGTLVTTGREATDRVGFQLALPRTLAKGEVHEFVLRFRAPEGKPMSPHYVCVPKGRCDVYRLQVRFGPGRPAGVWRLDGVFQRDLDDPMATGEPISLDEAGEANTEFRRLHAGLAYGIRWQGPQASPGDAHAE